MTAIQEEKTRQGKEEENVKERGRKESCMGVARVFISVSKRKEKRWGDWRERERWGFYEVEGEAREEDVGHDLLLRGALAEGSVPRICPLGGLEGSDKGDAEEGGEDVDDAILVGGAHGLDPGLLHDSLAHDALEGSRLIGDHSCDDREPREGELLEGSERNTADDGDERGVHLPGLDVAGEDDLIDGRESGLAGLEDLAEGDGTGTEGDDGATVSAGGPEADGGEGLPAVSVHLGLLAEAEDPEGDDPEGADEELDRGNGPDEAALGAADAVEGLLVVDVVCWATRG